MNNHPALKALASATKGFLYVSETEAALVPFLWKEADLSKQRLAELAGARNGTAVEETTLDAFFRTVSNEDKAKFEKLALAIRNHLSEVKVFKIGDEAEKQVYVVGRTTDGQWAGVKAVVVET